ncbi:MAG: hypothetical protein L0287_26840, partial [Anaerolineae bacterium]|nr:hypothetical protein [Anaerolineae bacterium]
MFAMRTGKEIAIRILLIAAVLFSALSPTSVRANTIGNKQETNASTDANDNFASELTLGLNAPTASEPVPVLSEEIAKRAQQVEEKTVAFKVWAEPAIYIPDKPITLYWAVENINLESVKDAEVVIHAPVGLTSADPNQTYTKDGLITISLNSEKNSSTWNVEKDAELPIYFTLDLLVKDDLIAYETVVIDGSQLSVEKDTGGKIASVDGKVEVTVPATAIDESLIFDIREPAPNTLPGVSLTWQPLEIIAVEPVSQKNVEQFKEPVEIMVKYDESQIFNWDENALTIYYYDEDLLDWFPLDTTVDTKNNTLTAYSDHLTVFDYKANNWQSQS